MTKIKQKLTMQKLTVKANDKLKALAYMKGLTIIQLIETLVDDESARVRTAWLNAGKEEGQAL